MKSFLLLSLPILASSATYDFEVDGAAIPGVDDLDTAWHNGAALNATLSILAPNDVFVVPFGKVFYLMGGVIASGLEDVTLRFDGSLVFSDDIDAWPRDADGHVLECLEFNSFTNVTLTSCAAYVPPLLGDDTYHQPSPPSDGAGLIDGRGGRWWGVPGIGYLVRGEDRPRLLRLTNPHSVLVENLYLKDSPYWTFYASDCDDLEVRYCTVSAARTALEAHGLVDLTAFNTDGFDVSGKAVWVHDVEVWNQDDAIAVKDGSSDMLFERVTASGVGLTVGSIGCSKVENITFRDCYMYDTYKGIYLKFRDCSTEGECGTIKNVTYENIRIVRPTQWAIWIGPAQQSDSNQLCAAHPCSICWPQDPTAQCHAPPASAYSSITLRNVTVVLDASVDSDLKPFGVVLANASAPMADILFEDVVVVQNNLLSTGGGAWGGGDDDDNDDGDDGGGYYACEGVLSGVATGATWPVPPCFADQTTRTTGRYKKPPTG